MGVLDKFKPWKKLGDGPSANGTTSFARQTQQGTEVLQVMKDGTRVVTEPDGTKKTVYTPPPPPPTSATATTDARNEHLSLVNNASKQKNISTPVTASVAPAPAAPVAPIKTDLTTVNPIKREPLSATQVNNGSPSSTDAHDRFAPAYQGAGKVKDVEHLKNGDTLTTTVSGAQFETTKEGNTYMTHPAQKPIANSHAHTGLGGLEMGAGDKSDLEAVGPVSATNPKVTPVNNPTYDVGGDVSTHNTGPDDLSAVGPVSVTNPKVDLKGDSAGTGPGITGPGTVEPTSASSNTYDVGGVLHQAPAGAALIDGSTPAPAATPATPSEPTSASSNTYDVGGVLRQAPAGAALIDGSTPALASAPVYIDAHDRPAPHAPAYHGGADVVSVKHLKNGATLTTTASGAQIEQMPGHKAYQVKAPDPVIAPEPKNEAPFTLPGMSPHDVVNEAPFSPPAAPQGHHVGGMLME